MLNFINIIQLIVVVVVIYCFYKLFISNTGSEKLVRGLFGLGALWGCSFVFGWMNLNILAGFAHWVALFLSISLIVIFQPELRKFLALLGNVEELNRFLHKGKLKKNTSADLDEIVNAVEFMSQKHTGALIVFPHTFDDSVIEKKGVLIDSRISTELLLTIFFNKTPLHDGAVIIERGRIEYAGAILPLSQNNLNWKYGTRHRAALGMSELSSATVLVVSEESGDISIAEKGKFTKYDDIKKLRGKIEKVLNK
ncbi:MAG: diadenylate cyclase CdaA [Proteobacteria bacterium]|nr:diadenylate cyclase CdaA [Candidatus Enterousia scatequi]